MFQIKFESNSLRCLDPDLLADEVSGMVLLHSKKIVDLERCGTELLLTMYH